MKLQILTVFYWAVQEIVGSEGATEKMADELADRVDHRIQHERLDFLIILTKF